LKKILSLILALLMIFSVTVLAEGEVTLDAAKAELLSGATINGEILRYTKKDDYFGFKDVDLTGVKHIAIEGKNVVTGGANGDTFMVKTDDPLTGKVIGYLVMDENREGLFKAPVKATEGKHNLYFVSLYGASRGGSDIKKVILSKVEYVRDTKSMQVSDDVVIDLYADTWAATDSFGRKVADSPLYPQQRYPLKGPTPKSAHLLKLRTSTQ
jgi:hypothetical protein